jgi:hypothetical protein
MRAIFITGNFLSGQMEFNPDLKTDDIYMLLFYIHIPIMMTSVG